MKRAFALGLFAALVATAAPRTAEAYDWELSLSIGEGVYFLDGEAFRGPVSLEVVPSLGFDWVKLDFGLYGLLEDTDAADRNFILRPGLRVTPPMLPLYFRGAIPLQVTNDFDWGFLLGLGVALPMDSPFALFVEANTFLTDEGDFGGDVVPLEFRVGGMIRF